MNLVRAGGFWWKESFFYRLVGNEQVEEDGLQLNGTPHQQTSLLPEKENTTRWTGIRPPSPSHSSFWVILFSFGKQAAKGGRWCSISIDGKSSLTE